MKSIVIITLVCFLHTVSMVTAMTNGEFLKFVNDYSTDVEVLNEDYDDIVDDWNSADVIDLTGSLDDEVDLESAIVPLLNELNTNENDEDSDDLDLYQYDGDSNLGGFRCTCRKGSCQCCGSHTFKAKVFFRRIKFKLRACVSVVLSRSNLGATVTVTLQGKRVYKKSFSLKNPPGMCFGVPGLKRFARICLNLYKINFRSRSMCLKLTGTIDLKIKKFRAKIKLGCIRIPKTDEEAFAMAIRESKTLGGLLLAGEYQSKNDDTMQFENME